MDKAAILGARLLEFGGYVILLFCSFVLLVYVSAHFGCILATENSGFEFECAEAKTSQILASYL
jgi:hypothetical protein